MSQETLFDIETDKIKQDFMEFHTKHPEVYRELLRLTYEWKRAGNNKLGARMLIERLRWEWRTRADMRDKYDFKLNNNYCALYAREIMQHHPDLEGIFELRERKTQVI
jgi:hypothetical protein